MIAPADSTEEAIAERMQEVRRRGHANAYHLRVGVDRVSDWREHVKAYPLPSVIAACVAGYWATTKLFRIGQYLRRFLKPPKAHLKARLKSQKLLLRQALLHLQVQ